MNYLFAYFLNSLWQIPILALCTTGIANLQRKSGALFIHRLWIACFFLSVLLPAASLSRTISSDKNAESPAATFSISAAHAPTAVERWTAFEAVTHHFQTYAKWAFRILLGLYLLSVALGSLRFLLAFVRTRRIVGTSDSFVLSPQTAARVRSIADVMEVHPFPAFLAADVTTPATVNWPRPLVLLPETFVAVQCEDAVAAISHELAHIKRGDFTTSLAIELLSIAAFYHPVLHWVKRRVNTSREMVCDDIAAAVIADRNEYAHALIRLAKRFHCGATIPSLSLGAFHTTTLEDRVQWLSTIRPARSQRAGFWGTGLAACALAVTSLVAAKSVLASFSSQMAIEALANEMEYRAAADPVPGNSSASPSTNRVLAIARGDKAKILSIPSGAYRYQWMDARHRAVVMVSTSHAEPSDEEKSRVEATLSITFGESASGAMVVAPPTPNLAPSGHAEKAHLVEGPGSYIHHWIGENGKSVEIASSDPRGPDIRERHRIERQLLSESEMLRQATSRLHNQISLSTNHP